MIFKLSNNLNFRIKNAFYFQGLANHNDTAELNGYHFKTDGARKVVYTDVQIFIVKNPLSTKVDILNVLPLEYTLLDQCNKILSKTFSGKIKSSSTRQLIK